MRSFSEYLLHLKEIQNTVATFSIPPLQEVIGSLFSFLHCSFSILNSADKSAFVYVISFSQPPVVAFLFRFHNTSHLNKHFQTQENWLTCLPEETVSENGFPQYLIKENLFQTSALTES